MHTSVGALRGDPLRHVLTTGVALLCAVLAAGLLALPASASSEDAGSQPASVADKSAHADLREAAEVVPGALIVTTADERAGRQFRGASWSAVAAAVPALRGAAARSLGGRSTLVSVVPGREATATRALLALPGVLAVERDRVLAWSATPNDPRFVSGQQWPHTQANTVAAWDVTTGRSDVRVAVLDSGMFGSHEDLAGAIVEQLDFSSGTPQGLTLGSDNDPCAIGHGTAVGGVIGAVGNNNLGVAGVAWQVSLIDVGLSSPATGCGGPRDSDVVAALHFLADRQPVPGFGVHVANMSFGGPSGSCPTALQQALDRTRNAGITLIAAAGNSGDSLFEGEVPQSPASCNGVVSVAATGSSGSRAPYSTLNRWVDVAAPGGSSDQGPLVVTTCHPTPSAAGVPCPGATNPYTAVAGTSFAAPYVAGVAALVQSARLDAGSATLDAAQLEAVLEHTASGLGQRNDGTGFGLVNSRAAVDLALNPPGGVIPAPLGASGFPVGDGHPLIMRLSNRSGTTTAIEQAVLVSDALFADQGAAHAVIARADDYADALAGSSLGYGVAPLLFSTPTGPLAGPTRSELQRVLPPGGRVYLLGGAAALPGSLDNELRGMGYQVVRLSGPTREHTAAAVGREVRRRVGELGDTVPPAAIVATRGNWPDAVAAGSLGSAFGIPILLTSRDGLHSATRAALQEFGAQTVYVIGGTAAVSEPTALAAGQASPGAQVTRLGGGSRTITAVRVAEQMERLLAAAQLQPAAAIAVNLRRSDGFAHVLSASVLAGGLFDAGQSGTAFGVFVPVEGNGGTTVAADTAPYTCGLGTDIIVQGGTDLVAHAAAEAIQAEAARPFNSC